MLKEEVAIQNLKVMRGFWEDDSVKEYIDIAIEALEKRIPEEPIAQPLGKVQYQHYCPDCGEKLGSSNITFLHDEEYVKVSGENKYCRNCGKRLRWTND